MQILFCAATEVEIKPAIEFIQKNKITSVTVLITGVGLTAATYQLTRAVLTNKPDFILQAGIAGCLNEKLPLTKIVVVENETIGDIGVQQNGKFNSLFELNLLEKNNFPWTNGKLSNNIDTLKQTGLTFVDSVTVNEISTSPERIAYYKNTLGADIESMEGAALHYVALMENIPFLQIRALSNFAGERDKSKWVLDIAIANLNLELERLLSKFIIV